MYERRGEQRSERRVHLSEAAEIMGVSKDAVRMRVKRGTLRSEKGEDGRVYVWVNVIPNDDPNGVHPQGEVDPYRELVEELRDRVRSLEDANRENRRIIAALTQRIPELEPPKSPVEHLEDEEDLRESSGMDTRDAERRQQWHSQRYNTPRAETPGEASESAQERQESSGPTETSSASSDEILSESERPSWWRRFFGERS